MANLKASDSPFPSILIAEATEPAAPAAGHQRLYVDSTTHVLMITNSSGTQSAIGGGLSDPMTTRGDIIVRNASNVSARLAIGSSGKVLQSDGTDISWQTPASGFSDPMTTRGDIIVRNASNVTARLATGAAGTVLNGGTDPSFAFPPGYEFDYAQVTSNVNVTQTGGTSSATTDLVVAGNAVTYDGSTVVLIEFYAPFINADNTAASRNMLLFLYDGTSPIGRIDLVVTQVASVIAHRASNAFKRITPSNASHTYSIRASVSAGTGTVGAAAGTTTLDVPAFIRITKV